jgi:ATP-binding cassette, subfamily B, multidrug efflux pump
MSLETDPDSHSPVSPHPEPEAEQDVRLPAPNSGGPWGRMAAPGMPLERSKSFRGTLHRLVVRLRPEATRTIVSIALAAVGVTFAAFGPKILGDATNVIVAGVVHTPHAIDFSALHRLIFGVVLLYIGSALCQYLSAYTLAGVVQRSMQRLRSDVEDKLTRVPLSYVDQTGRGELLSRVTNDIDNLGQSLQQTIGQTMTNVFMMIATVILMFSISPLLAVVALVSIPLSAGIIRFVTVRSRTRFIAQWTHTGRLNALVEESLTGHDVVKTFGGQRQVEAEFRDTNEQMYRASFGAQFMSGSIQPLMVMVGNLNYVAIAVIGGVRVASGALSIGDIQAFIQYSRQFAQPIQMLASMANQFQSGLASAERVFEFLDAPEQTPDEPAATNVAASQPAGRVAFEHVWFSYDSERPLIQDLSLVAEPGQTVAIVGRTGAGKTTLVNLIMRFYELDRGRITLDGRDIATMPRADLRSQIGMVLQDTWMFEGTIRDNIAYGNPRASESDIIAAASAAYVDRFVHALSHGYDTVVDDEGGVISTGEKQLVTIARAFLSNPTILILDEATSSVDTRTEVLIQDAMAKLRAQRTSFVIAHRLSTVRNADTILVMDGGQIVEQGHHSDLLAQDGTYAKLYAAQFAGIET